MTDIVWELERETVEQLASIVGPSSAAASALRESEKFTDPVFFRGSGSIVVCDRSTFDRDFKPLVGGGE